MSRDEATQTELEEEESILHRRVAHEDTQGWDIVTTPKSKNTSVHALEGGHDTVPRMINISGEEAAGMNGDLRVSQLIGEVDGRKVEGKAGLNRRIK